MAEPGYRRPSLRSQPPGGQDGAMIGPLGIVIVLVIAIPVGVLISGGIASAILGYFLKEEAEIAAILTRFFDPLETVR